jgi:hypothetical protein
VPFVLPAPLVMSPIEARDALVAEALWEHGRDPTVDGVVGVVDYRRAIGERGWLEGAIGVQAAALGGGASGRSLLDATVGAGYRVGEHTAVRARVGLPSAAAAGSAGAAAAAIADLRVDDRASSRPQTTSFGADLDWRLAGDDGGRAFAQVEAGFEAWAGPGDDVPVLRLGVAGGVRAAPRTWLLAELTTIAFILDDAPPPPGGDFIHALDLGVSIDVPRGAIAARLEVPCDDALRVRDDVAVGVAWRYTP